MEIGDRVRISPDEGFFRGEGRIVRRFPTEQENEQAGGNTEYGGIDYEWVVKLDVPQTDLAEVAFFEEDLEVIP